MDSTPGNVARGEIDFGVGGLAALFARRDEPVILVAALYQYSRQCCSRGRTPASSPSAISPEGQWSWLALAVAAARYLPSGSSSPLERIGIAAQALEGGDLARRVPPGGPDEIGRLADTFNRMAGSVQRSYENMERPVVARATLSSSCREPRRAASGGYRVPTGRRGPRGRRDGRRGRSPSGGGAS